MRDPDSSPAAVSAERVSGPPRRQTRRGRLITPMNFLLATRDSGYRNSAAAVSEFIDNSIQASARHISIDVSRRADSPYPIEISVADNGHGMDPDALAVALSFGGSTRFGNRSSLGRYGMGLPNAALSVARRVDVYTWRVGQLLHAYLDLDDTATTEHSSIPIAHLRDGPNFLPDSETGTVVRLTKCDRLDYKRSSSLLSKWKTELGRIYRVFLRDGLVITLNGQRVPSVDPLLLETPQGVPPARPFGSPLRYEFTLGDAVGWVEARFSELPIEALHDRSNKEKRELGITGAPTVTVVRANREIDRGWYFMGAKRRENYDDWWRCEISFSAELDDLFGITHTKQSITPRGELASVLSVELEPIARALNARVRRRFELLKAVLPLTRAEEIATQAAVSLPPLPDDESETTPRRPQGADSRRTIWHGVPDGHLIRPDDLSTTAAFEFTRLGQGIHVQLNTHHPLYRDVLEPLAMGEKADDHWLATKVGLLLLAIARAEADNRGPSDRARLAEFRTSWSDALACFLGAVDG